MISRLWAATMLAALLSGCSDGAPQTCIVSRVVDLPLLPGTPVPAVEASLQGQKVLVYIDTGAAVSIITRDASERFNLRPGSEAGLVRLVGVGGTVNAPLVKVPNLTLGSGIARNLELPVASDLGGPVHGIPVLGLFGADFLSNYDVDLDVPGHRFAMYRLHSCGSNIQPFGASGFAVPFQLTDSKIVLDLKLDGKPVTGFLDSGSTHTLVPADMAGEAGVDEAGMGADRTAKVRGIDEARLDVRVHRFGSLEIGDEKMNNFRFGVADSNATDLMLGDDFLRFNRVWISYPLQRLIVQPAVPTSLTPGGH